MASDATVTPTLPTTPEVIPPVTTPEIPATPSGETGTLLTTPPAEVPKVEGEAPKPAEPAKVEEKPPAFVLTDLKLPEGVPADDPQLTQFSKIAADHNIPTAAAQELVNMFQTSAQGFVKANQDAWTDVNKTWTKEIEADPNIGGANLHTKTLPAISKMLDSVAGPELGLEVRKALNLTGAGNNPAIVRLFAKMAAAFSEGSYVQGGAASSTKPAPGAEAMYPNLPKG